MLALPPQPDSEAPAVACRPFLSLPAQRKRKPLATACQDLALEDGGFIYRRRGFIIISASEKQARLQHLKILCVHCRQAAQGGGRCTFSALFCFFKVQITLESSQISFSCRSLLVRWTRGMEGQFSAFSRPIKWIEELLTRPECWSSRPRAASPNYQSVFMGLFFCSFFAHCTSWQPKAWQLIRAQQENSEICNNGLLSFARGKGG